MPFPPSERATPPGHDDAAQTDGLAHLLDAGPVTGRSSRQRVDQPVAGYSPTAKDSTNTDAGVPGRGVYPSGPVELYRCRSRRSLRALNLKYPA